MRQRQSLGRVGRIKSEEPMPDTWEEAVLHIITAHEGAVSVQEICRKMEPHPLVTPHHRELWRGGQPNYHHWIRSVLAKLKRRGAIQRIGHGLYISN